MLRETRQEKILALLREHTALSNAELVDACGVSVETVRRDLLMLEAEGYISRVHGGAVIRGEMKPIANLSERLRAQNAEKQELSELACRFVAENDIIAIDAGSTAVCFAEALKRHFTHLTVITHSHDVFCALSDTEFDLVLSGGSFMREENAFIGSFALDVIQSFHVHKAFICPAAVSLEYGICDLNDSLSQIQRKMMHNADCVYILADSTKFETRSLLRISDTKEDYHYITDSRLAHSLSTLYRENNINIHFPEVLESKKG